jgi:hypothetical protein
LNAFADFELRTELDPDNTDVACNHEGSPLRVIPEETEAGSDTNTTETELPACTYDNKGQWAKRNWQQQKEPLTGNYSPIGPYWDYWEEFDTSFIGWTYEAWQCRYFDQIQVKGEFVGADFVWTYKTLVWSPFPSEFIPAGQEQPFEYGYPTEQQLDALGTCVGGEYFTYSYLEPESYSFYSVWYHAKIDCSESVLRIYSWLYPANLYPEDYARRP